MDIHAHAPNAGFSHRHDQSGDPLLYLVCFREDREFQIAHQYTRISIDSVGQAVDLLRLLGSSARFACSKAFQLRQPMPVREIHNALALDPSIEENQPGVEQIAQQLQGVPLALPALLNSPLAVADDDLPPPPIDPRWVHKKKAPMSCSSSPWRRGRSGISTCAPPSPRSSLTMTPTMCRAC